VPAILIGGVMADLFGRRKVNLWTNFAFLLLIVPVFMWVVAAHAAPALIIGMVLLSVASNLGAAAQLVCLTETLPARVRGAAFGVVYSVAIAAFGGTTQLVVTWLIHVTGSAMAPAFYLVAATAVGQLGYCLIHESAPGRGVVAAAA